MKVVILAGGFGTRISEESHLVPKPMIEIGRRPILWHIMKYYSSYGFNEFIICAGYKQYIIKEFFADYYLHMSDVTFDFSKKNEMTIHNNFSEPWKVTVVDTGLNTMTGGRIKRVKDFIGNEKFFMTYGDGVTDANLDKLLKFHNNSGKLATLTAIKPEGRFGILDIGDNQIINDFKEKPKDDSGWINGGFMILEPGIFEFIEDDNTIFERKPLQKLAKNCQLAAYQHNGFWQCMDTLRDKEYLEKKWATGEAKWKIW